MININLRLTKLGLTGSSQTRAILFTLVTDNEIRSVGWAQKQNGVATRLIFSDDRKFKSGRDHLHDFISNRLSIAPSRH